MFRDLSAVESSAVYWLLYNISIDIDVYRYSALKPEWLVGVTLVEILQPKLSCSVSLCQNCSSGCEFVVDYLCNTQHTVAYSQTIGVP